VYSAALAAAGNALTQGIAQATGLQDGFNWKSVAVSAIAAPLTRGISEGIGLSGTDFTSSLARGFIGGVVSQRIRMAVYNEGKLDYAAIAADAFGNALGNSITDTLSQPEFSGVGAANSDFRRQEIAQMNAQALANVSGADDAYYSTVETQRFERQAASAADRNVAQALDPVDDNWSLMPGADNSNAPTSRRSTYLVGRGDNPASIGRAYYGDERAGAAILAANGLDTSVRGARSLQIGQVLDLPEGISEAGMRAGGRLIGADSAVRAQEAAVAAQRVTEGAAQNDQIMANHAAQTGASGASDVIGFCARPQNESLQAQLRDGPQMSSWDPAADRSRAESNRRFQNDLAIQFGGPVFSGWGAGARLAGAPEFVVEGLLESQFGLVGSLGAASGGYRSTSLRPVGEVDQNVSGQLSLQKQTRHVLDGKGYDGGGYFKDQNGLTANDQAELVLGAYKSGAAEILDYKSVSSSEVNAVVRWNEVTGLHPLQ
jgi:hypothetical protein